ncbi:BA14K family protein [Arvimicrobium flavum]|uniref:BA14K family protein n=1 Tax=Arvimicrobium flavum TaxID=3393320 RepID=UPI00237A12F0|nr:BA14K family protein [Mesorhizobium shangrilense]
MTKLKSALCAILALSFAGSTAVPLSAAPLSAVGAVRDAVNTGSDVTQIQHRERRDYRERRHYQERRQYRERHGWHNGHRGYRHKRPGYRYYNGYWFPGAAFIAGAIVGGALNNDRPGVVRGGSAHVRWCYDRWRSYRASDNTYQPYNGPRRQCLSPYN